MVFVDHEWSYHIIDGRNLLFRDLEVGTLFR